MCSKNHLCDTSEFYVIGKALRSLLQLTLTDKKKAASYLKKTVKLIIYIYIYLFNNDGLKILFVQGRNQNTQMFLYIRNLTYNSTHEGK